MRRCIYLLIAVVLLVPFASAYAGEGFESSTHKIKVDLPARWNLEDSRDDPFKAWARFGDSDRVATVYVQARGPNLGKYSSHADWGEGRFRRLLKTFAGNYGYRVKDSKELKNITIANSFNLSVIESKVVINNNTRLVTHAYFTNKQGTKWYFAFLTSQGGSGDHSADVAKVLNEYVSLL